MAPNRKTNTTELPLRAENNHVQSYDQNPVSPDPTREAYLHWAERYDYYNKRLFGGVLPKAIIVLRRMPKTAGYFLRNSMDNRSGAVVHEIALNPTLFKLLGDREADQTMVHEQTHLWRFVFGPRGKNGKPGAAGYHDRHWADKMEAVGLKPFNTRDPSKRTGYSVSDRVIDGGPFDIAHRELAIAGTLIDWRDHAFGSALAATQGSTGDDNGASNEQAKKKDRIKFTCSGCKLNAWAKPKAKLDCGVCKQPMAPAGATG